MLVEGGLTTRFSDIRGVLAPASALATVGVVVSTLITAVGAHLLLGMDWQLALLLGAIVASTDAAAVFSVLRILPLPRRLAGLLEAESGFNDAPAVILVLMFSVVPFVFHPEGAITDLLYELVDRFAAGLGRGVRRGVRLAPDRAARLGSLSDRHVRARFHRVRCRGQCPRERFHRRVSVGSGPGQLGLPHKSAHPFLRRGVGWLAQIGLFVLLGLLVNPHDLPGDIIPAIVIGLVLLLIARPVSVVLSLAGFRIPLREQLFLSWAGLRGAVPIVLATFPIVAGVPDSATGCSTSCSSSS